MEEEQYYKRLKEIEAESDKAKKQLYIDFAKSKTIFKVGDIIKDCRYTLLIDKLSTHKSFGLPKPVYAGLELKKDLTPRKDGNRVAIYGNDAELIKSV